MLLAYLLHTAAQSRLHFKHEGPSEPDMSTEHRIHLLFRWCWRHLSAWYLANLTQPSAVHRTSFAWSLHIICLRPSFSDHVKAFLLHPSFSHGPFLSKQFLQKPYFKPFVTVQSTPLHAWILLPWSSHLQSPWLAICAQPSSMQIHCVESWTKHNCLSSAGVILLQPGNTQTGSSVAQWTIFYSKKNFHIIARRTSSVHVHNSNHVSTVLYYKQISNRAKSYKRQSS